MYYYGVEKGYLEKSDLNVFSNTRKGGIIAVNLRNDDELIDVRLVKNDKEENQDVILCSRMGLALRTNLFQMRSQGRSASGIIGMRLSDDDAIIGMDVVTDTSCLLVISEKVLGNEWIIIILLPKDGEGEV